jgi:uncharacterized protein (TIGR02118 family)
LRSPATQAVAGRSLAGAPSLASGDESNATAHVGDRSDVDGYRLPMIKVTVLYPSTDDSTFDTDYYRTTHAEIVRRVLKPERFDIDKGLDGQPFHAIGYLLYASQDAMKAGMGSPDAGEAMADITNFYKGGQPQIQISEVLD